MSEADVKRVQLTGGPEKTVTWIWLEQGLLKVEYYDFSETAQRLFGNDIAYTITVRDMDKLFSTIHQDATSVMPWMESYFQSYFGVKQWLEENGIGFTLEVEGWA